MKARTNKSKAAAARTLQARGDFLNSSLRFSISANPNPFGSMKNIVLNLIYYTTFLGKEPIEKKFELLCIIDRVDFKNN